ncbi:hypothetical protein AB1N83_004206 [Pleurotus pulmonarius]
MQYYGQRTNFKRPNNTSLGTWDSIPDITADRTWHQQAVGGKLSGRVGRTPTLPGSSTANATARPDMAILNRQNDLAPTSNTFPQVFESEADRLILHAGTPPLTVSDSPSTVDTNTMEIHYSLAVCPFCGFNHSRLCCGSVPVNPVNHVASNTDLSGVRCFCAFLRDENRQSEPLSADHTININEAIGDNTSQQGQDTYSHPNLEYLHCDDQQTEDTMLAYQDHSQPYLSGPDCIGPDYVYVASESSVMTEPRDQVEPISKYLDIFERAVNTTQMGGTWKSFFDVAAGLSEQILVPSTPARAVGSPAMTYASGTRRTNEARFFGPYEGCIGCRAGFTAKHNLIGHMRAHENDKPFKCNECSSAFTTKGDLNRHFRSRKHIGTTPNRAEPSSSAVDLDIALSLRSRAYQTLLRSEVKETETGPRGIRRSSVHSLGSSRYLIWHFCSSGCISLEARLLLVASTRWTVGTLAHVKLSARNVCVASPAEVPTNKRKIGPALPLYTVMRGSSPLYLGVCYSPERGWIDYLCMLNVPNVEFLNIRRAE